MCEINHERRFHISLVIAVLVSVSGMVAAGEWGGAVVVGALVVAAVLAVCGAIAGLERASGPSQGGGDE